MAHGQMHEGNPQSDSESDVDLLTAEPPQYAVVLHNDDYTTMEFVIEVLVRFFRKNRDEAMTITLAVHQQGRGVAGIYSYEIAETKAAQVVELARTRGHPLQATTEPA